MLDAFKVLTSMKLNTRRKPSLLAASAVAGLGLSAGRDTWAVLKKNSYTVLFLLAFAGVVVGPFLGMREMVRGHDRSFVGTVFKTLLGSLLLTAVGVLLGCGIVALLWFWTGSATILALAGVFIFAIACAGAIAGLVMGLFQRPARKRGFDIARQNDEFLRQQGFRETGGTDITHYDGAGNALRLIERHPERIVFMVVGRRSKRSYITLSQEGAMTGYSGS